MIKPSEWKKFNEWRDEQVHKTFNSDEYRDLKARRDALEALSTNYPDMTPDDKFFSEQEIKIVKSKQRLLLDRIPERTIEGYLDYITFRKAA